MTDSALLPIVSRLREIVDGTTPAARLTTLAATYAAAARREFARRRDAELYLERAVAGSAVARMEGPPLARFTEMLAAFRVAWADLDRLEGTRVSPAELE